MTSNIFTFESSDSIIHINLREVQAISDIKYQETAYGEDVYDDGFKRHFSVGGGQSKGSFEIHLKGKDHPFRISHSGSRLEGKIREAAEKAGERSLTAEERKYMSSNVKKVAAFMNAQPNTFIRGKKFKADYKALLKAWTGAINE